MMPKCCAYILSYYGDQTQSEILYSVSQLEIYQVAYLLKYPCINIS